METPWRVVASPPAPPVEGHARGWPDRFGAGDGPFWPHPDLDGTVYVSALAAAGSVGSETWSDPEAWSLASSGDGVLGPLPSGWWSAGAVRGVGAGVFVIIVARPHVRAP